MSNESEVSRVTHIIGICTRCEVEWPAPILSAYLRIRRQESLKKVQ